MSSARELTDLLAKKAQFELVDLQDGPSQIRIMGRVRSDGTNANISNWLLVIRDLLTREKEQSCTWRVDVSKSYFLKGPKVVYGWRLVFQAPGMDVRSCITDILAAVRRAPPATNIMVDEMPLMGASPDRNTPNRGKGAGSVLQAPPIASLVGANVRGG